MEMADVIDLVPLIRCPLCDNYQPYDGPEGLIRHLLLDHPWSAEAIFIRKLMEEPVV
jgi:hypothetical protein